MEFFNRIIQLLKKPFPMEESKSLYFRNIILVSVFVTFFLYVFQPFGISYVESNKFWICLGFGTMTFIPSVIYDWITDSILKYKRRAEVFTFAKWILYMVGLMLCISLANFLFARIIFFGDIRWEYFPQMVYGTFAIGVFPIVVIGAISLLRQEKKYQNIANEMNLHKVDASQLLKEDAQSIFNIHLNQIRYIEALQNYVKIGYITAEGQLKEQTERSTLKKVLDETNGSPIVKCHRSYLVNRNAIISTSGNAQGLILTLSDCDRNIPVSRSYVSIFRDD